MNYERIKDNPKFIEENKKIIDLHNGGHMPNEMGSKLNLSLRTLRKRFTHLNIPAPKEDKRGYFEGVKKRREFFKERDKEQNERILDLYNQGKMIIEIVPVVGISRGTVARRLDSMGINKRERELNGFKFMAQTQKTKRDLKFNEENKKILSLYNNGYLIKEIAKEIRCNINTITKRLNNMGTNKYERMKQARKRSGIQFMRNDIPLEIIKDLYFNKKMSTVQIGKKFNCSSTLILNRLKRNGVDRRIAPMGVFGEKNIAWQGGKSFEPYSPEFNKQFKNNVRQRDNQICMNCGIHREKLTRALHIHHVNYDKLLTTPENCISLCDSCHALTNTNREYWTKLFQEKLLKFYGYQYDEKGNVILELTKSEEGK